jgi:hypothetical protein
MMILATFAAAAPAAVVVRNKTQKYYSLARSPLRLPGSADIMMIDCTSINDLVIIM